MFFSKRALIVLLFLIVYLPLQFYLFLRVRRCAHATARTERARRLLSGLTAGFFLAMLLPLGWRALFDVYGYQPYAWPVRALFSASSIWGFGSVGCSLVLLAYSFFRRIILLASPKLRETPDLQRRRFLKKGATAAATAPFLISGYGVLLGPRRFQMEHFTVPVSGLSSSLSGLTVVQLTDIHVGPFMPAEELAEYVEAVNRLQPDLIALTGDFVSGSRIEADPCAEVLGGLKARHGVFACIGNHDIYARADHELTRLFAERGVLTLRNHGIAVPVGNSQIDVLGIEDLRWGEPDLSRAVRAVADRPGEVRLLLSHRPEIFPAAARNGIDMVMAGHYHGGQIKLGTEPESLSIARFLTPYAEGFFRLSGQLRSGSGNGREATLFVSRGIGITGVPIRLNCPPQIAHLTLKKA